MGPRHAQGHIFDFSTNLYALEHAHVVQIWIMRINALKTQLMHKNVQTNPEKSQNLTQHSCYSMLTLEKDWKQEEETDIISSKRWHVPYWNHEACCEKFWFLRSLYPNLPQMGQKNYDGMLMSLHDSMPCFMNYRRVLDLLEFENHVSNNGMVFDIHSHFLHGT